MPDPEWRMGELAAWPEALPPEQDAFEAAAARTRAPYAQAYEAAQQRPTNINTLAKGVVNAGIQSVQTPGSLMEPNPYPPGSEEWQWYADNNSKVATEWAPQQAVNRIAMGTPFAQSGAVGMAGGKLRSSKPTLSGFAPGSVAEPLFDYSKIHNVPDVKQFDLPRYAPPRGAPARVTDLTENKAVRKEMLDLIEKGKNMKAETFYYNEPLRDAFVAELGKKEGPKSFERYMDYVAATSPRSDVETNARNASYYYMLEKQGLPVPEQGGKNPQPYGHMAQNLHRGNAENIRSGAYFDTANNPKPLSFSQNLQGNFAPVTVDAHAFKLPGMLAKDPRFVAGSVKLDKDSPTVNPSKMLAEGKISMDELLQRPVFWASKPNKTEYAAMENYYKDLAKEAGMTPAQTQAAAWAGGGKMTGLESVAGDPFMKSVENRAIKTAAERGITPQEALSQMMRGKAPLLGIAGAGAVAPHVLGGLAAQDQYRY